MSEDVEMIKKLHASGVNFNDSDLINTPEDIRIPGLWSRSCSASVVGAEFDKPRALTAIIECNGLDYIVKSFAEQGFPYSSRILKIIYQAIRAAYIKNKPASKLAEFTVPMSFTATQCKMSSLGRKGRCK